MATHNYGLRSKTVSAASAQGCEHAMPTISSLPDPEDVLLRTMSDHRGGLLSTRPAPKKIKATSGEALLAVWNYDPSSLSDLSDLTDLEDEVPDTESQPNKKKRRR